MNQRTKQLLFVIVGLIVNFVIITAVYTILIFIALLIMGNGSNEESADRVQLIILITSLAAGFGIYYPLLGWANKKWNLEKHLGRSLWGRKK